MAPALINYFTITALSLALYLSSQRYAQPIVESMPFWSIRSLMENGTPCIMGKFASASGPFSRAINNSLSLCAAMASAYWKFSSAERYRDLPIRLHLSPKTFTRSTLVNVPFINPSLISLTSRLIIRSLS